MKRSDLYLIAASLFLCAPMLTSCGGSGSSSSVAPRPPTRPSASAAPSGNVGFILSIPAKRNTRHAGNHQRKISFISPNAWSVATSINGTVHVSNISPGQPGCEQDPSGSIKCTVWASAPIGNDDIALKLYDASDAQGHLLSEGSLSVNIADAAPEIIPVTMNAYVGAIEVDLPYYKTNGCGVQPLDMSRPLPVTILAYDPSGALITSPGKFMNPITLMLADTSGKASLSSTIVSRPDDQVTLTYGGQEYTSTVSVAAQAANVDPANVVSATLDPGADRPLEPNSTAHYSVAYNGFTTLQTDVVRGRSGYPQLYFTDVLSNMPTPPGTLCLLESTIPAVPQDTMPVHPVDTWAEFLLDTGDTSKNVTYDVYLSSVKSGPIGADTLLYAVHGIPMPVDPSWILFRHGPEQVNFNPAVMGYLPHGASRAFVASAHEVWDYKYACISNGPDPCPPSYYYWRSDVDLTPGSEQEHVVDATEEFTFPMGPYQTSWASLGEDSISPLCTTGSGIPTVAVHLQMNGVSRATSSMLRRGNSAQRTPETGGIGNPPLPPPTPAPRPWATWQLDEWVSRKVGVVCRVFSDGKGFIGTVQSLLDYSVSTPPPRGR